MSTNEEYELTDEDREWLDMKPIGKEFGSDEYDEEEDSEE